MTLGAGAPGGSSCPEDARPSPLMPASRVIRDPDGLGWVVEYGTGKVWRILSAGELGFVGSDKRQPTEAEQTESTRRTYMGTARRQTDPWDHASPFGHADAHHVVNPDGLRLLRDWHD